MTIRPTRRLQCGFAAASAAWAAALPTAALAASRSDPTLFSFGFSLAAYAIGSVICHQLPDRSFHLWGRQLPVCARCTGIYIGAAAAAIVSLAIRRARRARVPPLTMACAGALPTAATLLFEWTTGITPGNWTRAGAGVVLGAAVGWILARSLEPNRATVSAPSPWPAKR
jgi:hypothetical protein